MGSGLVFGFERDFVTNPMASGGVWVCFTDLLQKLLSFRRVRDSSS